MKKLIISAFTAILLACASLPKPLPDPIPQDIQTVVACVLPLLAEGVVDPKKLEDVCAPGQDQLIIDVLALLGESKMLNPAVSTAAKIGYVNGVRAFLKNHNVQLEAP